MPQLASESYLAMDPAVPPWMVVAAGFDMHSPKCGYGWVAAPCEAVRLCRVRREARSGLDPDFWIYDSVGMGDQSSEAIGG